MKENRCFLYSLIVYDKLAYTHEKFELKPLDVDIDTINKITLPDYVYDKHTAQGNRNKETAHYKFFIDNIVLIPRYGDKETDIEIEGKRLYTEYNKPTKAFLDPLPNDIVLKHYPPPDTKLLETHKYLQTQLITGRNKPKVYYWDYKDDGTYSKVIKGPINRYDYMRNKLTDMLKKDIGLKCQHLKYSNGWMIANNFIKINPNEYIKKTSKLETNVNIFSGQTHGCTKDTIDALTELGKLEWLKCLTFRKFAGTNDTCFRNFLNVNGHVYTIDDPLLGDYTTEYMFKTKLNPAIASKFMKAIDEHFDELTAWLTECENKIKSATYLTKYQKRPMITKIRELQNKQNWRF